MSKSATFTEMIERTVSEILKGVGTSIPGHILSVSGQLAKIQIGVQFVDVNGNDFAIAPIVNVPVYFPGGDYCIEYEIKAGNEGIVLISQRCIDAWKEQGGVAEQPILRKLDFQDAMFIPGLRSKPNQLSSFQNNGIRMRNKDGSQYLWLKSDGSIEGKCSTFSIDCNDISLSSTTLKHNGTNIGEDHRHPQGADSAGNSEQDTGGPQ